MDEIGKGDVYKAERILDTKNVKVTLTRVYEIWFKECV